MTESLRRIYFTPFNSSEGPPGNPIGCQARPTLLCRAEAFCLWQPLFGRGERGSSCWAFAWAGRAVSNTGSESDVSLTLANLETGILSWKGSLQVGVPSSAPPARGREGSPQLLRPPAQVWRHRNSLVSLREEELQLCNHQVPNHKHLGGNSCGEHLAELEYGLSFLGMEILIT